MPEQIPPKAPRYGLLGRLGCGTLVVLWFMILLLPCILFTLATQGSIVINHANVPEPDSHPLLQIDLLTEADYRGFRIVTTQIYNYDDQLCVQSNVSYFLWLGEGAPSVYCDCYVQDSAESEWRLTGTTLENCLVTP